MVAHGMKPATIDERNWQVRDKCVMCDTLMCFTIWNTWSLMLSLFAHIIHTHWNVYSYCDAHSNWLTLLFCNLLVSLLRRLSVRWMSHLGQEDRRHRVGNSFIHSFITGSSWDQGHGGELEIPLQKNKNNKNFPKWRWKEVGESPEPEKVHGRRLILQELD